MIVGARGERGPGGSGMARVSGDRIAAPTGAGLSGSNRADSLNRQAAEMEARATLSDGVGRLMGAASTGLALAAAATGVGALAPGPAGRASAGLTAILSAASAGAAQLSSNAANQSKMQSQQAATLRAQANEAAKAKPAPAAAPAARPAPNSRGGGGDRGGYRGDTYGGRASAVDPGRADMASRIC